MWKAGDRAVIKVPERFRARDNGDIAPRHDGEIVTITSGLVVDDALAGRFGYPAVIESNGLEALCVPEVLVPLPPKPVREDLAVVRWDACLWQPSRRAA